MNSEVVKYLVVFAKWIEEHSLVITMLIVFLGVVDGLLSLYAVWNCDNIIELNPFHTLLGFNVVTALEFALITRALAVTITILILNLNVNELVKFALSLMLTTWLVLSIYTIVHNVDVIYVYCLIFGSSTSEFRGVNIEFCLA